MASSTSTPPSAPAGRTKTVLVLSGGGANGAVEVGFFKAIHEFDIRIDLVIGTSVGAINGAMIASGLPPDEIIRRWHLATPSAFLKWNWGELLRRGMRARSLYDPGSLRRFLNDAIPARQFADLTIPFMAVATDALTGEPAPFTGGDLISAVQASCAIPAIYPPAMINGRQYVDGGVSRQVPVDLAIDAGASTTIVCMAECRSDQRTQVHSFLETWMRAFTLAINRGILSPGFMEYYGQRTRLVILEPCFRLPVTPRHIFDMRNTDILMKFAYEFAKGKLEQEGFAPPDTLRTADSVFGN
jgi:NTE family protein